YDTCPESQPESLLRNVPSRNPFRTHLRSTTRVSECTASLPKAPECTMKPSERNYHGSLRMRHVSPEESECAVSKTYSGCLRARRVSRVAEPREPLPGALRVGRAPRAPTPGDHPGHSASVPRVPGCDSFFSRINNN